MQSVKRKVQTQGFDLHLSFCIEHFAFNIHQLFAATPAGVVQPTFPLPGGALRDHRLMAVIPPG
jgi:hypothetical protein